MAAAMTPSFLSIAHRILRDIGLAEDATQLALLNVWRGLPRLRELERFEAWSHRLLIRACYTEGRRSRQWEPPAREPLDDDWRTPDGMSAVVDRDELERAFRRLSLDHRAVVVLRHYRQLSMDEVAAALGVPVGTAASRLHYAMGALRSAVEADARPAEGRIVW